ncbi:hypothetical protein [Fibrella aquatilis]|uniref:Uncharacterized protein n=1 Tax=Fibrella aquatilis TaxID=2817059 RepID=A0A939GBJ9_9BACT|nr:hypothetical protein [Fibrella aquatilis]MBO0933840.1 hypothetical protein [Fibrella aquatilis]
MNLSTYTFSQKVAGAVVLLLLLWHVQVATSSKTRLSGPFMAKPGQPGYVWADLNNADSRFFWDLADLRWKAGIPHPNFRAESAEQLGEWVPQPGYTFVNKARDLTAVWVAGLTHPRYKGVSDKTEGTWKPEPGYKFVYKDGEILDAVWMPNVRVDEYKLLTLSPQGKYKPYPGYRFLQPGQSLQLVWVPGMVNYDNTRLTAGNTEGSWIEVRRAVAVATREVDYGGKTYVERVFRNKTPKLVDKLIDKL